MPPRSETDSAVVLGALVALVADAVAERLRQAHHDGDDVAAPRPAFWM
jgi:hypothetical protein